MTILYEQKFFAMGCQMMAALEAPSPDIAVPLADGWPASKEAKLLAQVPQWFEQWEQHLSRFRTDSELSALNRSSGIPFPASPILWDVFSLAVLAEQRSRGWVTPTIYDALVDSGYAQSFTDGVPPASFTEKPVPHPAPLLNQVQADAHQRTITLPPGVHLDFGGIAKGWAADAALQRLRSAGPAIVDAGGDIAVGEPLNGDQPWPVAIETLSGSSDELLMLSHCGVATSGRDYRRWQNNGVWQHHLIDPHTGQSARTDVLRATVIAPTVIDAELAAKVVLLAGHSEGLDWLEAVQGCEGMVILEDGRRMVSRYFDTYLWRDA